MSLDKAIKNGREHREQYRDSRAFDMTCRNHGAGRARPCPWCTRARQIDKLRKAADAKLREFE